MWNLSFQMSKSHFPMWNKYFHMQISMYGNKTWLRKSREILHLHVTSREDIYKHFQVRLHIYTKFEPQF